MLYYAIYLKSKFLYISDVEIGNYRYPMIFISDGGQELLDSFSITEEGKLDGLRKESIEIGAAATAMDSDSMILDRFLKNIVKIMTWLKAHTGENITEERIRNVFDIDDQQWDQCAMFFDTLLLGLAKEEWYHPGNTNRIIDRFHKGIRGFLANVPEVQAAAFRAHYEIEDMFYHSQEELIEYYSLQPEDLQESLKNIIKRFFYKKWKRRSWIVKDITNILFAEEDVYPTDDVDEDGNEDDDDVKVKTAEIDTYTQTLMLYKQGYSISEIAQMRDLKESTIMGHFAKLIPEHDLNPYEFVDKERVEVIIEVARRVGDESFRAIKGNLPEDYEYGEISIALALKDDMGL
ncbi:MAG TPA: helix-turn-helix domain-containing protein [Clostridia bacterium]|nr:helix-turn-helix domain-containing protein [Clostridia bacterium]